LEIAIPSIQSGQKNSMLFARDFFTELKFCKLMLILHFVKKICFSKLSSKSTLFSSGRLFQVAMGMLWVVRNVKDCVEKVTSTGNEISQYLKRIIRFEHSTSRSSLPFLSAANNCIDFHQNTHK
jgi:hypothetical protein